MKIKICGITNIEDAMCAIHYGTYALGFVFYEKSPRSVTPEEAGKIIAALPPFITTVGVFVDEKKENIDEIIKVSGIDCVQLHGNELPEMCVNWPCVIKAIRVKDPTYVQNLDIYKTRAILLDTYVPGMPGGTGEVFNWNIAKNIASQKNVILAGGLNAENVKNAINNVNPYAIDVSSSLEKKPGIKDHEKIRIFMEEAKA